jgi:hypothetical protein
MAILDPETIPSEIKDQIEAGANDLAKGLTWLADTDPQSQYASPEPHNDDPRVLLLAQGFQRAMTAFAMMILPDPNQFPDE